MEVARIRLGGEGSTGLYTGRRDLRADASHGRRGPKPSPSADKGRQPSAKAARRGTSPVSPGIGRTVAAWWCAWLACLSAHTPVSRWTTGGLKQPVPAAVAGPRVPDPGAAANLANWQTQFSILPLGFENRARPWLARCGKREQFSRSRGCAYPTL